MIFCIIVADLVVAMREQQFQFRSKFSTHQNIEEKITTVIATIT